VSFLGKLSHVKVVVTGRETRCGCEHTFRKAHPFLEGWKKMQGRAHYHPSRHPVSQCSRRNARERYELRCQEMAFMTGALFEERREAIHVAPPYSSCLTGYLAPTPNLFALPPSLEISSHLLPHSFTLYPTHTHVAVSLSSSLQHHSWVGRNLIGGAERVP